MRPFYFNVAFWDEDFRNHFLDFCLASLMSEGNIPSLTNKKDSRFLIATTKEDWNAMKDAAIFQMLERHVTPVHIEITVPESSEVNLLKMSEGHKAASAMTFAARAYGIFLSPETILSDGTITALERLARAGKHVVLVSAVRFGLEGIADELKRQGRFTPGQPLSVDSRTAVAVALDNLHSHTEHCNYAAPIMLEFPVHVWWWVGPKHKPDGIILHTFSWSPILVDYGTLDDHDDGVFEKWTLDGDYIYQNFGNSDDVYVVTDSDEFMLVGLTPIDDQKVALDNVMTRFMFKAWPGFRRSLISGVFHNEVMDPLKRRIFLQSVRYRATPNSESWERAEKKAREIIKNSINAANFPKTNSLYEIFFGPIYVITHPWMTLTFLLKFPAALIPKKWRNAIKVTAGRLFVTTPDGGGVPRESNKR